MPTMTVPALRKNSEARSHVCNNVPRSVGIRYGGNSMTKGVTSPRNTVNRNTLISTTAKMIPTR